MKKIMLLFIIILFFTATGCMNKVEIPEEKEDILAEHISALVLKYDKYYAQALIYNESKDGEDSNTAPTEEKNTDTDEKKEEITEEKAPDTADNSGDIKSDGQIDTKAYHLSEVMNLKGLEIKYSKYGLYDTYPKKSKNTYFTLDARSNRKLLVAEFKITNKTNKNKRINLMSSQIDYTLDVNAASSFKPIITLLINDLQYIDVEIKADSSQTGYLVFEVPKGIKLDNTSIIISNGQMTSTTKLK